MIRIAVMLDAARVIGSSDPDENEARFPLLPPALPGVMQALYRPDNIVAGLPSVGAALSIEPRPMIYGLARGGGDAPDGVTVVTDYTELVDRFQTSDDELLVGGGLTVFDLFTPHASRIDIAEADELVPGNLVYDSWERSGAFTLQAEERWEGGRTLRYVRSA